jgi:carboxyl-terminal processing protease
MGQVGQVRRVGWIVTRLRACVLVALVIALVQSSAPRADDTLDQGARLSALAKVWGLLKYFHPGVAQGTINWDVSLVDELPRIQAAVTKPAFNDEVLRFMQSAGSAPRTTPGAPLDQPEADPAFRWIEDQQLFEPATIGALKTIRFAAVSGTNRYVRPVINVGNPDFSQESPYDVPAFPSTGMRFLALARFWNMVQYYAPNRDITDRPWADVLPVLLPHFLDAADANAYHLAVCELTASIDDTHAFTSSSTLNIVWGVNTPGIRTRDIESQTVVTDAFDRLTANADLRPGDIVTDINGVQAADIRARLHPYVWGSNEGARQRNIDALMFRTNASTTTLGISRFGVRKEVVVRTVSPTDVAAEALIVDTRPAKWRVLDSNIGYVHMGLLQPADVTAAMNAVFNTSAIIFDVRNYPNGTMYQIANLLNPVGRPFVMFTRPRFDQPGTVTSDVYINAGQSNPGYYRGKVILLGDERTQSHAEFTMMALRTAPDVTIVGSQTAGADGNVSLIPLPGGIRTYFSGLGVFYPDGRPTQRVGIMPDIVAMPTIAGIQNGVDEVLERALALVR